jgi:hypothetical protein
VLLSIAGGCHSQELASHERDRNIVIDGDQTEWSGKISTLGSKNIAVGLMNDDTDLYLCMSSSDRDVIRQVVLQGLTIWFDSEGGRDKRIGINYPLGVSMPLSPMRPGGRPERGAESDREDEKKMLRSILDEQTEISIVGPEEEELSRIPISSADGIKVATGFTDDGRFVYEVQVPLGSSGGAESPVMIDAVAGGKIGIGFLTGEIVFAGGEDRMKEGGFGTPGGGMGGPGMGGPGGRGGMGGGPGGPGGGPGGGMGSPSMEPLEVWTKVVLADAP